MNITEGRIRDELGLVKQNDIENRPYFQLDSRGHFYWKEGDVYYFRADEDEVSINGVYATGIITDWNIFKKLFL